MTSTFLPAESKAHRAFELSQAPTRRINWRMVLVLISVFQLSGCTSFGPRNVTPDRFDYNEAIADSAKKQMLLNIVRLRYLDIPVFLTVSSVLTQYTYGGNLGLSGSVGQTAGASTDNLGANTGILYAERPTVTYTPLSGEDFARQLLTPISADLVLSLISSGWPPDQLLMMCLQRLNDFTNLGALSPNDEGSPEASNQFFEVIKSYIALAKRNLLENQIETHNEQSYSYIVFENPNSDEERNLIKSFKTRLDLVQEIDRFRVTENRVRRKPDEITIRVRSMLTLMDFLSQGVELPERHLSEQRAPSSTVPEGHPIRIHASSKRPKDAFAAVKYKGYWFFINDSDHASKLAFGLVDYLFRLKAPEALSTGPLLTVPTG